MASGLTPVTDARAAVLHAIDIVELVGRSVALKRRGKDFVGLCPFHQEKTPSFHVSPSKQFFHCYGCKKGGNAIDFVMARDRIEFKEALRLLAEAANIRLPAWGENRERAGERQSLLDAHSAAGQFFQSRLAHPEDGRLAREYLERRGIDQESIKRFCIGLSPLGWDGLIKGPVGRKFSPALLATAGLAKQRDPDGGGYYDTFRNRLMFPIRDESSRTIAFGGRVMPESEDPAKYLNSPESPLFSKSRCVFGLDLGRARIVETRTAVVVEGYTDVVVAHQFGLSNVVSVLGTALTEHHVATLRRFADKIVLLFDPDAAGDNAVNRAIELFLSQPIEIHIASLPAGRDPDELLLSDGPEAFEKLVAGAQDALTYKWTQLDRQVRAAGGAMTVRQKAVDDYLQVLAGARQGGSLDNLRWHQGLSRVSRLLEVPLEELRKRFLSAGRSARRPGKGSPASGPGRSDAAAHGAAGRGDSSAGAPVAADGTTPPGTPAIEPARLRAERCILGCLLAEPGRWSNVQLHFGVSDFADPQLRRLAEVYWAHQRDEGEPVFNEFLGVLSETGLSELAIGLVEEAEALADAGVLLDGALDHLRSQKRRDEERQLVAQLRRTGDGPEDRDSAREFLRELQDRARVPDLRRV